MIADRMRIAIYALLASAQGASGCTCSKAATSDDASPASVPAPPPVPPPKCVPLATTPPATLASVKEHAIALAVDGASVFVATETAVWKVPAKGGGATRLAGDFGLMTVRSLAARSGGLWVGLGAWFEKGSLGGIASIDPSTGKVTWIDKNTRSVFSIAASDTDVYWLRKETIRYYDQEYWTSDPGYSLLVLSRAEGSKPAILIDRETGSPSAVALDPGRALYWIDAHNGRTVTRHPLPFDAWKRETLLDDRTITKLLDGDVLQWMGGEDPVTDGWHVFLLVGHPNFGGMRVWWTQTDGGAPEPFDDATIAASPQGTSIPWHGIAVDATYVWWLDPPRGLLLRRDKARACPAQVVAADLQAPDRLVVTGGAAFFTQGRDPTVVTRVGP
jgi:hypothetical protein